MRRFENKVAIVTGAGKGLGKAYAESFLEEGATVILAEYNEELGKATTAEFTGKGYDAIFIKCDVSKEEDVKKVVKMTIDKYGEIDILVNNAQATDPRTIPARIEDTTLELFKLEWSTGLFGTFLFMKYALPHMKEKNYGRIINVASAVGILGMATYAALGSEKEGTRALTRVCTREYGRYGITCNVICPGAFTEASKQWKEACPDEYEAAISQQNILHMGDPKTEIAPVVMFLASDDAKYVSGQTIACDGGVTML